MRQRLALAALALAGAVASPAAADPKPKPIDTSKVRDQLDVYRDDAGHYFVAMRGGGDDSSEWVFYGDGKTLYQQRVIGNTYSSDDGAEYTLWAPRVATQAGAEVSLPAPIGSAARKPTITCDTKAVRALVQLPADQAKAVITRAQFLPPLWARGAHLIARDDDGTYYLVDMLRDDSGTGVGHRLFVGKKTPGGMKEVALTNVVSDPAGEVFNTKDGSLKTFGSSDKPPVWRHGDKVTELTPLDLTDPATRLIIYRDFGIYGALGTPCD